MRNLKKALRIALSVGWYLQHMNKYISHIIVIMTLIACSSNHQKRTSSNELKMGEIDRIEIVIFPDKKPEPLKDFPI